MILEGGVYPNLSSLSASMSQWSSNILTTFTLSLQTAANNGVLPKMSLGFGLHPASKIRHTKMLSPREAAQCNGTRLNSSWNLELPESLSIAAKELSSSSMPELDERNSASK